MRITCSILCHNYGRYLRQAIVSCIEQEPSHCELEVVVVDDGSTDNTQDVCREFEGEVRVIRSDESMGFGASLDRAINEASGDYVCLLDADDFFARNKIRTLIPYIERGYLFIQDTPQAVDERGQPIDSGAGPGSTSTICVRREAALTLLPSLNEIFFHPIRLAGKSETICATLTMYRIHNQSMLRSTPRGSWYKHLADVTRQLAERLTVMSANPPFWATSTQLLKIAAGYRSLSSYNAMEAALFHDDYLAALTNIPAFFRWAIRSDTGLTRWHLRVAARGLLNGKLI